MERRGRIEEKKKKKKKKKKINEYLRDTIPNHFEEKSGVNKPVKGFGGVQKSTKHSAAVLYVIVDGLS